ncbi:MAG TPA: DUF922 domain-containing protein [Flavisolibacter sp.]|jgi:hypothetical protein|nr:DUF922 domain-containing protein [Flavisolibacter sp.]
MNHLFSSILYIALFALSFSGMPVTSKEPMVKTIRSVPAVKKEDDELIPWTLTRRLNWEDFLCEPQRHTDAVASTSTSLGIAYQVEKGELTYHITCNFSKNKSWGLLKTDYILAHEQGHFDITELFARKLYQELSAYEFNKKTYRKDVNDIYMKIVREKEDMQAAYDGESDHSRKKKTQYEWLDKIDQMLDETAPYAAYP